jgi:predicted DsbA family dithiol-disulfide isomerase
MLIDMIFDTICPWCFIGKKRLDDMLARKPSLNTEIRWHAFLLNPDMPLEGADYDGYVYEKFGDKLRSREINNAIYLAGHTVGIDFDFTRVKRLPNSVDSHRLVRFATRKNRAAEMLEMLYQNHFIIGRDISNRAILIDIANDLGFDEIELREYLYSEEDIVDIYEQNSKSHRHGIRGVPTFIFAKQFAISGAQDPAVLQRMLSIAEETQHEFDETDTQLIQRIN